MKNMLGNSESLRELLQGPITDLLVKLNGENGQEVLVELNKFNRHEPCWILNSAEVAKTPEPPKLVLTGTGPTFGAWLVARERLHQFLTEENIVLQDMFEIPEEILARTDIMPVFRPVGASNRIALDWKVKLGMKPSYEEADVMKYRNAEGPKVPQLFFINRSVKPDADTLGKKAKSPDGLMEVPNTIWTGLYGWSDADNLHFLITSTHLDSGETWTWFTDDRLPGDKKVAFGFWAPSFDQAYFCWYSRNDCYPFIGGRVAKALSLKKS
jgi:hypothetical protein